jgi:hypothetical protein
MNGAVQAEIWTAASPGGDERCVIENNRHGGGERYVLSGRIGPFSIAGVHVRVAGAPAQGEPVTLRLHGVGHFLGQVSRADGERIRLSFGAFPASAAELVRVRPAA